MQKISQHAIKKTIRTMNKLREKIQNMRYITACKILYIKYVFFKIIEKKLDMTSVPMLMPFPAVRAVHTSLGKTAASVKCTNCYFYVDKDDEILKCSGSKT